MLKCLIFGHFVFLPNTRGLWKAADWETLPRTVTVRNRG